MRRRSGLIAQIRKVAGFAALPAIGFLSSLVILPVISVRFGADGWPSVALGMSIGGGAGILAALGWGVGGPMRVARAGERAQARLYVLALVTQVLVAVPLSLVAAMVAVLLAPAFPATAALMAFTYCWAGLSPAWFFVGSGHPSRILMTDTVPRVICSFAAAGALLMHGPLWLYPGSQLLAVGFGLLLGMRLVGARLRHAGRYTMRRILAVMRLQLVELQGNAASSLYIALPAAIVGAVSPASLGIFASANRLQRMLLRLLNSVPNAFQHWVGSAGSADSRRERAVRALRINALIGAFCGLCFAAGGPLASEIIFAGRFTIGYPLSCLCAVVIFATQTSRASGRIALVSHRRVDILRTSAVLGAAIGIVAVIVGAKVGGALGAMAGEAIAEVIVLAVQLYGLRRVRKEPIRQGKGRATRVDQQSITDVSAEDS